MKFVIRKQIKELKNIVLVVICILISMLSFDFISIFR